MKRSYTLENANADFPGIYAIINNLNGRIYIGSSMNIRKRWNLHRHHLAKGIHHNKRLQRSWNKYGDAAFTFKVLEEVGRVELILKYELEWMEHLCALDRHRGFNDIPPQGSRAGFAVSQETRQKIRLRLQGRSIPEAQKDKMRATLIKKDWKNVAADKMGKSFEATDPQGNKFTGVGLNRFCREHGLDVAHMARVALGVYKHHKGWTCRYI